MSHELKQSIEQALRRAVNNPDAKIVWPKTCTRYVCFFKYAYRDYWTPVDFGSYNEVVTHGLLEGESAACWIIEEEL